MRILGFIFCETYTIVRNEACIVALSPFYILIYLLNASKNATFTEQPYSGFNAILSFVIKYKHKPMVAVSSQYSICAGKAVRISQAVFFDKGTQPELRHKNCKITLLIWISDPHNEWFLWIQTFGKINIALLSMQQATDFFCLEVLTFKMVIKVSA